MNFRYKVSRRN